MDLSLLVSFTSLQKVNLAPLCVFATVFLPPPTILKIEATLGWHRDSVLLASLPLYSTFAAQEKARAIWIFRVGAEI